jgi:Cys-tRNA(Pro) deacylase
VEVKSFLIKEINMTTPLKDSARRVQQVLQQHNLDIQVVEFKDTTRSAQEAADTIGCEIGQIAKTLIFKGEYNARPICIIVSGKNKVNEKKIERLVEQAIEKPDADFVLKHTGFAIGGVPPVGYTLDIDPLIDQDLMSYKEIWVAAGTPFSVFNITPNNLVRITGGRLVDIKKQSPRYLLKFS